MKDTSIECTNRSRMDEKQSQKNPNELRENLVNNVRFKDLIDMSIPLREFVNEFEKQMIEHVLSFTHGSEKRAAYLLGIKPTTLCEKMKKHKIILRDFRN